MNTEIEKKFLKYREELLMTIDGIDHFLTCSVENYEFMFNFASEHGYDGVVDIGCAHGFQSEICNQHLDYVGVNDELLDFWIPTHKITSTRYIVLKYPFKKDHYENLKKGYLAISNLCLGWNCYATEDNSYEKQFKALSEDFGACLLYVPIERESYLKKYFKNVEMVESYDSHVLPTAFFYCF